MRLADQWRELQASLGGDWENVRLALTARDEQAAERAAALLGPANPGRHGRHVRFFAARSGGPSPEAVRRLLGRLDEERVEGELELVSLGETVKPPAPARRRLAAAWDEALAALPPDWSDVYAEVELASSDHVERAALLLSPVNPARYGGTMALRFRCARSSGYGASPEMARRCFARLDEESIRGEVRILRALSDTRHVSTQGPVWYVEGKSV